MAHQVEAEAVDLVLRRPRQHRVDEELLHHVVLGGGVRAAAGVFHGPVQAEPVVVAGHDAVEHRVLVLPCSVGVVVDDVHDGAEADAAQPLHHLAELDDPRGSVGIRGIASLGHRVVPRIVAPVESVFVGERYHRCLLLVGIRRIAGEIARRLPLRLVLVDGGDVERRQQVDVRQPCERQGGEMAHAVRGEMRECLERSAQPCRDRRITGAEVAHVQLVDRDVLRRGERRLSQAVPTWRLQRGAGEVDVRALLRDRLTEYGSVTRLFSTRPVLRVNTLTSYR